MKEVEFDWEKYYEEKHRQIKEYYEQKEKQDRDGE